ncbi:MAG: hypothetical protein WCV72_04545 [Patescibacteria group bacterium]
MSKILKIGVACALTCVLTNAALATEFDPITDITDSNALLGLDLPTSFDEDLNALTIPEPVEVAEPTPVIETNDPVDYFPVETTTPTALLTTIGSGGALGVEDEEPAPTKTLVTPHKQIANQLLATPTPSSFSNSEMLSAVSGSMISGNIMSSSTVHNYGLHSSATKSQLAETGPAETLAFACGAAIGLAIFIRRKLHHA